MSRTSGVPNQQPVTGQQESSDTAWGAAARSRSSVDGEDADRTQFRRLRRIGICITLHDRSGAIEHVERLGHQGGVVLDASASSGTTQVQFVLKQGASATVVIGTAVPTIYGWIALWNSTTVPNGTYALGSVASANGTTGSSTSITITVDNTPPTTTLLVPSSGATLFGPAILDATAPDNVGVTKVEFHLTGGTLNDATVATATPSLFGWDSRTVPNGTYTLQSVAYDAEGFSTHSSGIAVDVLNGPIA